jgi:hypothetical protein
MKRTVTESDKVKRHEWYTAHAEEIKARTIAWRKANPDARRKHRHTARGLVDATGEKKTGVCEFCLCIMQLQQDHDHETGKKRGWLCHRCNLLLGWWEIIVKENALGRLKQYIEKYT